MGFVFFAKSPRNLDIAEARELALRVPVGISKVALVVNADNAFLDQITASVPLDMLQLHGDESLERVAEVKARYGLPVMKALGIATSEDVERAQTYAGVADQLLLDAKPMAGQDLPGGNGLSFDWTLAARANLVCALDAGGRLDACQCGIGSATVWSAAGGCQFWHRNHAWPEKP